MLKRKLAMPKRKPTLAAGAVIERDAVRRWARRQMARPCTASGMLLLDSLLAWLKEQPARTKRKGGIGR